MNRYLFEMMLRLINEQLDAQEGLLTEARITLPLSTRPGKKGPPTWTVAHNLNNEQRTKAIVARQEAFDAFRAYLTSSDGAGRVSGSIKDAREDDGRKRTLGHEMLPRWYTLGFLPSNVARYPKQDWQAHYGPIIYIENMGSAKTRNDIVDSLTGSDGVTYGGWTFQIDPQHGLRKYERNDTLNIGGILSAYSGSVRIPNFTASLSSSSPNDPKDEEEKWKHEEKKWKDYLRNVRHEYSNYGLGNIQRFQIEFRGSSVEGNTSELFEGNLIMALNGYTGSFPPQGTTFNFIDNADWQQIANNIIPELQKQRSGSGGLISGQELTEQDRGSIKNPYYKPETAEGLTDIYKFYKDITDGGARTTKTPKTDIASKDEELRISVKKKGASLLSSEFAETKAFMAIALGFPAEEDVRDHPLFEEVKNALIQEPDDTVTPGVQARKGANALEKIYQHIKEQTEYDAFKQRFLIEAITGKHKFSSRSVAIANRLLFWDEDETGSYYDIEKWAMENFNSVQFVARPRGASTGFGIDPGKPTETPNEEINELRRSGIKFDPEIQIDLERPIPDQKINEFILTAIGYSLKEVDPGSNTVTIGYPDEEQERILLAMVQEMLGSPGKPEAPVQQDTETEIPDNVVALEPKDVKSTKDDEEIEDVEDDEEIEDVEDDEQEK